MLPSDCVGSILQQWCPLPSPGIRLYTCPILGPQVIPDLIASHFILKLGKGEKSFQVWAMSLLNEKKKEKIKPSSQDYFHK